MTPAEKLAGAIGPRRASLGRRRSRHPHPAWKPRLREARVRLRLSLRDVAAAVGLSLPAYWRIEHGGDVVLTNAAKLAAFFGLTVEELWPERAE